MQITRTHHDIQDVRYQVEQAKLRLTTDVKVKLSFVFMVLKHVLKCSSSYEIKLKTNVVRYDMN